MKSVLPVIFITSLISLSGCAKDYSLALPADNEKVTVTVISLVRFDRLLEEPSWDRTKYLS